MGRVLLEAMAAKKPVIVSSAGGLPFFVTDHDNGLVFRSEDADDLAEKLLTLLTDPELAARLAQRGRERTLHEFDETAYVRHFQQMIQTVAIPVGSRAATESHRRRRRGET